MLAQSHHGGRAELGQNFLTHQPTLVRIAELVATTKGSILEIGVGGCALTKHLCTLGRDLRAIDIDASRVKRLQAELKGVDIAHADVRREPLTRDVVVGNIPFHLTTPIMRRLLAEGDWTHAIVLTQWEVARKRAGVGGSTMMTSQAAPWFSFELHDRVPARYFRPMPSFDGGVLEIRRRETPVVADCDRKRYDRFVAAVFRGKGRGIRQIVRRLQSDPSTADLDRTLQRAGIAYSALPRDLTAKQWAELFSELQPRRRH